MRQFIREHPWRLEIVPFIIVLFAAITPLIFLSGMIAAGGYGTDWTGDYCGEASHVWLANYLLQLIVMVTFWIMGIYANHMWSLEEKVKTFNYNAILFILILSFLGMRMNHWDIPDYEIGRGLITPAIALNAHRLNVAWLVILATAWLVEALIERTRRFAPGNKRSEIVAAAVQSGDKFYYRETNSYWIPEVALWLMVFSGAIWFLLLNDYTTSFFPLIWIIYLKQNMPRILRNFVVSKERVSVRHRLRWFSIPMDKIRDCSVVTQKDVSVLKRWPNVHLYVPNEKTGRSLELLTTDGKIYILGMREPETACKLINTAIEAQNSAS